LLRAAYFFCGQQVCPTECLPVALQDIAFLNKKIKYDERWRVTAIVTWGKTKVTGNCDDMGVDAMLDALDKKIIIAMQNDFPLTREPYRQLAEQIGIDEDELLARLEKYKSSGEMRRMGAVLRHREVGFAANALCAWRVPAAAVAGVAAVMAADSAVTHCYERLAYPEWPYNFYIMLHGHTRPECRAIAARLSQAAGLEHYIMLFSTREWKKTTMSYFGRAKEE
jgi:siroheme decarboxylase